MQVRRRKFEDEEDQHDRWLISYADFITLLFAFFVVMYATSNINLNKYKALSDAVVAAFQGHRGSDGNGKNIDRPPLAILKPLPLSYLYQERNQRDAEKLHIIGQTLANAYTPWIESGKIHIFQHQRGIRIDMQDKGMFIAESADLTHEAIQILRILNTTLETEYRQLQIEGHTQQKSLAHWPKLSSAWEISALKAAKVAQSLINLGMIEKRLSVMGLANTHPLSSSEHAFAYATNQRVSIWILSADSVNVTAQDEGAGSELMPEMKSSTSPKLH